MEEVRHGENKYNHPYVPYKIQVDLMDAIYDTLENNYKVGIFESPTGTGKTLSIICSTMTWLRNYKKINNFTEKKEQADPEESDDEPDWVRMAYKKTIISKSKERIRDYELHLDKLQKEYNENYLDMNEIKSKRFKSNSSAYNDDDYLPRDYEDDSTNDEGSKLKTQINQLLEKMSSKSETIELVNECPTNIYFSSRTHSQLNQFSNQLSLTKFEPSFEGIQERTKYLPLGSRKQLCINKKVRNISKSDANINDACIDLQNLKEGCEFLSKDNNSVITKRFSDLSLTKVHSIEDLGDLGNNLKTCPYYSVRRGIPLTEIISLPYQMIFQDTTRQIMNLDIENSIIIIDEAHNILDVISSLYSVSISFDDITKIMKSLKVYLAKFLKRLKSNSRIMLMKLTKVCQLLANFITKNELLKNTAPGNEIPVEEIFEDSNGDMFNIHKIETFLNKSKIAYKIESYMEKIEDSSGDTSTSSSNPLLFKLIKFLKSLTNPSKEGRFFWDKSKDSTSINYMLLDPSGLFKEIIDKAKCVLLCGGTMEPVSDYMNYLFPTVPQNLVKTFSCGHVIPKENLAVYPVTRYNGQDFEFLFEKRNSTTMINNLGSMVEKICKSVPFGVVVFLPSYKYLEQVFKVWKELNILSNIQRIKRIFQEPTDSSKLELTLKEYTNEINLERGAILFSVVGGKMSEGINFSDNLARAVIMVGLPYPNAFSGEIIAKRQFIESRTLERGGTRQEAQNNSKSFYENICMRAVNQSIGRSIRHANDYSIIYLIDQRYLLPRIQNKLSGWVKERLEAKVYGPEEIIAKTEEFFTSKLVQKMKF